MFNQDREYHLREIARLINISPRYVGEELENLLSISLVKKQEKANLTIYSINKENIVLEELRRLFVKADHFTEILRPGPPVFRPGS